MKKILITGASGFIGSFIVEEALRRELEVWAAVRPTSSRKYLQDTRIRFIELDFGSEEKLTEQLRGHDFDYIVHAAGATKCLHREDFFRTNTEGTKHLVRAILRLSMPIEKFVYISSLSVFGPICEQQPYREILESDTPHPNTAYGESKLQAEKWLENIGKRREERGERRENTNIKVYGIVRTTCLLVNSFTRLLIYLSNCLLVKSFTCQLIYLTERGMCLFAHPSFCYYTFSCGRNWLTALQNYWLNSCLLST